MSAPHPGESTQGQAPRIAGADPPRRASLGRDPPHLLRQGPDATQGCGIHKKEGKKKFKGQKNSKG